ncbi:putative dual specificity phosphatase domain protein [Paratrimastix pyriformis]|uniref:Dual specificity phosphatase domain protein n=1 Tax=Paratrimastix pyriformis TaxID=342808 RepID=A0ABQ8U6Z1_9EUKA|nr:putative dual specificity phosphatase domain protein [Paratrimastix pyriformis]
MPSILDSPAPEIPILPISKVRDGLFIGDRFSVADKLFLANNKITHIINCAGRNGRPAWVNVPNRWAKMGIKYLTFSLQDEDNSIFLDPDDVNVTAVHNFTEDAAARMEGVIIHSYYGRSRALLVAAAHFMRKYGWAAELAIDVVHATRRLKMRDSFQAQLREYQARTSLTDLLPAPPIVSTQRRAPVNPGQAALEEATLLHNTHLNRFLEAPPAPVHPATPSRVYLSAAPVYRRHLGLGPTPVPAWHTATPHKCPAHVHNHRRSATIIVAAAQQQQQQTSSAPAAASALSRPLPIPAALAPSSVGSAPSWALAPRPSPPPASSSPGVRGAEAGAGEDEQPWLGDDGAPVEDDELAAAQSPPLTAAQMRARLAPASPTSLSHSAACGPHGGPSPGAGLRFARFGLGAVTEEPRGDRRHTPAAATRHHHLRAPPLASPSPAPSPPNATATATATASSAASIANQTAPTTAGSALRDALAALDAVGMGIGDATGGSPDGGITLADLPQRHQPPFAAAASSGRPLRLTPHGCGGAARPWQVSSREEDEASGSEEGSEEDDRPKCTSVSTAASSQLLHRNGAGGAASTSHGGTGNAPPGGSTSSLWAAFGKRGSLPDPPLPSPAPDPGGTDPAHAPITSGSTAAPLTPAADHSPGHCPAGPSSSPSRVSPATPLSRATYPHPQAPKAGSRPIRPRLGPGNAATIEHPVWLVGCRIHGSLGGSRCPPPHPPRLPRAFPIPALTSLPPGASTPAAGCLAAEPVAVSVAVSSASNPVPTPPAGGAPWPPGPPPEVPEASGGPESGPAGQGEEEGPVAAGGSPSKGRGTKKHARRPKHSSRSPQRSVTLASSSSGGLVASAQPCPGIGPGGQWAKCPESAALRAAGPRLLAQQPPAGWVLLAARHPVPRGVSAPLGHYSRGVPQGPARAAPSDAATEQPTAPGSSPARVLQAAGGATGVVGRRKWGGWVAGAAPQYTFSAWATFSPKVRQAMIRTPPSPPISAAAPGLFHGRSPLSLVSNGPPSPQLDEWTVGGARLRAPLTAGGQAASAHAAHAAHTAWRPPTRGQANNSLRASASRVAGGGGGNLTATTPTRGIVEQATLAGGGALGALAASMFGHRRDSPLLRSSISFAQSPASPLGVSPGGQLGWSMGATTRLGSPATPRTGTPRTGARLR